MKIETKYSIGDGFWRASLVKELMGDRNTRYRISVVGPYKVKSITIKEDVYIYEFTIGGETMTCDELDVAISSGEMFSSIYDAHSWIEKDCDNILFEIDNEKEE